ncbi:MAG: hypothetical protein LPK07_15175 [Hymenobacteraceae bacterium]|nr:hypothetical protein [Hymenobacteraceae bacterium]MDX5483019.1 hypothetical protein [Hymenobacteraceae bacterium]
MPWLNAPALRRVSLPDYFRSSGRPQGQEVQQGSTWPTLLPELLGEQLSASINRIIRILPEKILTTVPTDATTLCRRYWLQALQVM